jgi:hypothetical protein
VRTGRAHCGGRLYVVKAVYRLDCVGGDAERAQREVRRKGRGGIKRGVGKLRTFILAEPYGYSESLRGQHAVQRPPSQQNF